MHCLSSRNQVQFVPIMLLLTWEVFNVHTSEVAQSVLVVGGMVPDDAIIFAREVVKPAMDGCHPGQVIQHFLNFFNDFLENKEERGSDIQHFYICGAVELYYTGMCFYYLGSTC